MALTKNEIKYLQSLNTKRGRMQSRQFIAEGVRLLEEALISEYLPQSVYYAPPEIGDRGRKLVGDFAARKVETRTISARECHRLSDTKTSQGIVAVFDQREYSLAKQLNKSCRRILICDRVGDPGNLGTLIRSAVAFEFDLIITTRNSAEIFNPKAIRATMGGLFKIPIVAGVDDADLVGKLAENGITLYCADLRGKNIEQSTPIARQVALVLGSEASGGGRTLAENATYTIRIPISPKTESLNAAVAGSVLMFWIYSRERT